MEAALRELPERGELASREQHGPAACAGVERQHRLARGRLGRGGVVEQRAEQLLRAALFLRLLHEQSTDLLHEVCDMCLPRHEEQGERVRLAERAHLVRDVALAQIFPRVEDERRRLTSLERVHEIAQPVLLQGREPRGDDELAAAQETGVADVLEQARPGELMREAAAPREQAQAVARARRLEKGLQLDGHDDPSLRRLYNICAISTNAYRKIRLSARGSRCFFVLR